MLNLKIIENFQNPAPYIGDISIVKTRYCYSDYFDFFRDCMTISTDNDFIDQYFFPVFLKQDSDSRDTQLKQLKEFVLNNRELFVSKKLIIILVDILEAMDNWDVNKIDVFVSDLVDICKIYLLTGELKRSNCVVDHYSVAHWIHHKLEGVPEQVLDLDVDHKTFIFLNKMARPHRVQMIDSILSNGLRQHGYISFTKEITCCRDWPERYPAISTEVFDILDFENVLEKNPTQHVPLSHCRKSFLFLNTETYDRPNSLFITEKTFKPLRIGMPFITIANPGTLAYLQGLGFETFSKWIDESYDQVSDSDTKIKMITEELIKFSKMTPEQRLDIRQQMTSTLEHNKKLVNELTYAKPEIATVLENIELTSKI